MHQRNRLVHSHPRLMSALLFGTLIGVAIPLHLSLAAKALIGWNVAVWTYLVLVAWLMMRGNNQSMLKLARQEDSNAIFVLVVMSLGAVLSLVAIVIELASVTQTAGGARFLHYLLTGTTVMGSWLLLGVIYTLHYAHLFYRAPADRRPLRFPEELAEPGYADFLYFSFTIAVAAQTSDISVVHTSMRKAVLAQSVLSFVFNAAIIGMTINIAAGLVGN
ncbi:DUF1345 domain-containing protein [Noviherbaspirillum galbum]|uniref:DUF1345 domain-containing protein n=1 Tax=Noviherbaspirillum galbum TaxID=2709383 RepID=A0A6B3SRV0_9BURK|nr:DUF1345 domain-containing protein [Noviherbaspirillum galbum]NEX62065.1 DUF1345 domain-containing protein [Noviherbaspirillum galbum]